MSRDADMAPSANLAPSGEPPALPLFRELMELAHLLGRASAESMRRHGITPPQFVVLSLLAEAPYLQQQDIAARLHVTKGNVSQIVATLEREGLLEREGGRSALRLTARAAAALADLRPVHARQLEASFAPLGPEERRQLARLLARLRQGLLAQDRDPSGEPSPSGCPEPTDTPSSSDP